MIQFQIQFNKVLKYPSSISINYLSSLLFSSLRGSQPSHMLSSFNTSAPPPPTLITYIYISLKLDFHTTKPNWTHYLSSIKSTMASASLNKLIAMVVISLIVAAATAQFDNSRERCRHEMQESQLRSCKQFMMQRGRDMLMSFTNYEMRERCCRELRDISPQCRCDAIEEMMSDMREEMEEQRYRHGGHMSCRKMMEMAKRLPSMCHVSPGYCHMRERLMYWKLLWGKHACFMWCGE